ncbi:ATP-binding response regulator [Saccharicrinis fermentans]|uniref:Transcriptional regulatory protein YycF n=1 Tax=Saccharicrinis fermentans DSM 9555 = JCM 21142 TaxID=869213 RepID=W7Y2L6_9BACT|nr:response regulator [Saccharicrinis fermentans]GAF02212.1 transcriptional regulatory protein YycF [Saccharicrinis fermentans DSM 9555 = JCM 21142]
MDKKGKILVVDDNPKNIQVLGNILNDNNYDVEVALGGKEAIDWLKEDFFDLMLLDIMMPEVNGFEVCQTIRKESKHNIMPIIYLSAKNDKESTVYGFKVGGQDFINKPFDTAELLARVSTHIELKKSKEQILEANNQLEAKVYQRTLELEASNKKLLSITQTKDKFLSFIGKEITAPINSLNKAVNLIKHSAESSRLSEMVRLLEDSVRGLDFITKLASQITQINNKEEFNYQEFYLNGILEHLLIHSDELIENKNLELNCDVDDSIKISGSKELIKNSISGILDTVLKHTLENTVININLNTHNQQKELSISFNPPNWDSNNINSMPEETVLFFSYADIVMDFHEGSFVIKQDTNDTITFTWSFQ